MPWGNMGNRRTFLSWPAAGPSFPSSEALGVPRVTHGHKATLRDSPCLTYTLSNPLLRGHTPQSPRSSAPTATSQRPAFLGAPTSAPGCQGCQVRRELPHKALLPLWLRCPTCNRNPPWARG